MKAKASTIYFNCIGKRRKREADNGLFLSRLKRPYLTIEERRVVVDVGDLDREGAHSLEAGLPGVADPGAHVVATAHQMGIPVVSLAGPSSIVMALAASGLHGQSFAFVGYLPVEAGARGQRLRELEAISRRDQQTQLMIETPYRNQVFFEALLTHLTDTCMVSVSCGLTLPA